MTAPGRVVHVLNSTAIGGAEMLVLRLGERLQELGWSPEVLTLRGTGALAERFRESGMAVTDLAVPETGGVLRLRQAMRRWLQTAHPAVLHTHNVSPLVATALALPRRHPARFIHTKHGRARSRTWRGRALTRWAARRPDAIVAVSRDAATRAVEREGFPAERVQLIHNGIDTAPITPRTGRWGRRLVTVARLEPVKALDVLLRAVAMLRGTEREVTLTVVGDGSARPALEALAHQLDLAAVVAFSGWRADVAHELRAADLFVMSSRSEGLSLTLLEAMAVGLPVVATAVGGNPEVVAHDKTGLLVPPGDPAALADAIAAVLDQPDRAAALGAAGRERVLAHFSLDAMALAHDRLYRAA